MKISYLFDEDDYLNPQNFLRGREIVSWLIIEAIILLIGLALGRMTYWITQDLNFSIFLFCMVLLSLNLVLFGLFWLVIVIKLRFAQKRGLFGWIHINFTDDGFYLLRGPSLDKFPQNQGYFQEWSNVKRLRESKDYFYLSLGLGQEIMIPKRAFTDEEINQFKDLLQSRGNIDIK